MGHHPGPALRAPAGVAANTIQGRLCISATFCEKQNTHTHARTLPLRPPQQALKPGALWWGGDPGAEAHPPSSAQPGAVGASPACALLGQQRTSEDLLPSVPAGRMTTPGFGGLLFYCVGVWFAFLPPSLVDGPLSKRLGRGGGRRKGWCRPPPDSKAGVKSCTKA